MKVGVLVMAERLKSQFLEEEKIVDPVVGPDAYKDLPNLLSRGRRMRRYQCDFVER
jgi:tRNA-2-methylthio-N6-dimethylallyladenosine synthase